MSIKSWWGWKELVADFDRRITRCELAEKQKSCSHHQLKVCLCPSYSGRQSYYLSVICISCNSHLDVTALTKLAELTLKK